MASWLSNKEERAASSAGWPPAGVPCTGLMRRGLPLISSPSTRMIGLLEQRPDSVARHGFLQGVDEAVIAQAAGDVFQGTQVVARPVLRRDQQDKHVDRLAVEAVEGDAAFRQGHRADEAFNAVVF